MTIHPLWKSWWLHGRGYLISVSIFCIALLIFLHSPVTYVGDSKYSLLVSESLLNRGDFTLEGYSIPHKNPSEYGSAFLDGDIYQIEIIDNKLYYYFPPGVSILSVPFVIVGHFLGWSVVNPDMTYNLQKEIVIQHVSASFLMALLAVIFYQMGRLCLSTSWSVCLALGGTLGSPVWSTASRALWGHTWGILLMGCALYLVLLLETGRGKRLPILLASLLSWAYFVRPTNCIFIVGVTLYLVLFHRNIFIRYALTGVAWFAGFVLYSWENFHMILPAYFHLNRLGGVDFWEPKFGNLISPSRGLLIDMPIIFFIGYLLIRYGRASSHQFLIWLSTGVIVVQWLVVSGHGPWYAGVCFGPRFLSETVPWLVLLAEFGIAAMLQNREEANLGRHDLTRYVTLTAGGFLLLISVLINGWGANSTATVRWNIYPVTVDENPARVWDWRHPQCLAGLVWPECPSEFPKLDEHRVSFGNGGGKEFLYDGWSEGGDSLFWWSEGYKSTLIFTPTNLKANRLRIALRPHLVGEKIKEQRVTITLNGKQIATFSDDKPEVREFVFDLPKDALLERNFLTFQLPDAASPISLGEGDDQRSLGIGLYWLELDKITL